MQSIQFSQFTFKSIIIYQRLPFVLRYIIHSYNYHTHPIVVTFLFSQGAYNLDNETKELLTINTKEFISCRKSLVPNLEGGEALINQLTLCWMP